MSHAKVVKDLVSSFPNSSTTDSGSLWRIRAAYMALKMMTKQSSPRVSTRSNSAVSGGNRDMSILIAAGKASMIPKGDGNGNGRDYQE
jgi:hypothetical protein